MTILTKPKPPRGVGMSFKRSGAIWLRRADVRRRVVARVCTALRETYGEPRLGNPSDPVDDLVFITVSNKTAPTTAAAVFEALRRRFPRWDDLAAARMYEVRRIMKPAGLATVKARQLRAALRQIRKDFGSCDLSPLRKLPADDVERYLTTLPGVSQKVAKCVMIYTLDFAVLPVDVHVHRVASRLGWTARKRADQSHEELEALVPSALRYGFHVAAIAHGRQVCRPLPECQVCPVARDCDYYRRHVEKAPRRD
ncbi:MAG TPA: hypothetical protein VGF48_09935 [Thermoanaerobaculia bacterium]|jgi:endonuclease III